MKYKSKSKSKKIDFKNNKSKKIIKKNKDRVKSKKKIYKSTMRAGGEINIQMWGSMSDDDKNYLISETDPNNNNKLKDSIDEVRNLYRYKYVNKQLYDFIFSKNEAKIIKIWDHNVNDPNSITGGLPGIHLYTIYENGKYQVIAKFIRN